MNRFLNVLLIMAGLAMPFAGSVQGQVNNNIKVEVSKEKVLIKGVLYYLHTVKKGENLYRISLAYGVSQTDIMNANPETMTGPLKEGQILKIPVVAVAANSNPLINDQFIHHIVEEHQTLFYLTQKYKITQQELIHFNPVLGVSPELQVGQVVNIPKISVDSATSQVIQRVQKYSSYKVRRHDTKYSISRKNNITIEELMAANPVLDTEELKTREIIQIPLRNEVDIIVKAPVKQNISLNKDTVPASSCNTYVPYSGNYRVAMLLPFFIKQNKAYAVIDTLLDPDQAEVRSAEEKDLFQRSMNFVEFYEGALIAVDSLKKKGLHLQLYTYDADRDTLQIERLLQRPEMKNMDLIIGPFYADAVAKVAAFAQKNKIHMVSPVANNCSLLKTNPYLFQVIPNNRQYVSSTMKYIDTIRNKNVILVYSNHPSDLALCKMFKDTLDSAYAGKYKLFKFDDNTSDIHSLIVQGKQNIVILPTGNEGLASTILPMLNLDLQNDSIEVFGLANVMKWNTIEPDYLYNLNFHFCSAFFADYSNNELLKNFLKKYEAFNFSQPYFHTRENFPILMTREGYNFGFLGYDVTFYFLSALCNYGPDFDNCLNQLHVNLIHSRFNFEHYIPNGGYINRWMNVLSYTHDYYLIKDQPAVSQKNIGVGISGLKP